MLSKQETFDEEPLTDYLAYFGLDADPFDSSNFDFFQFGKRRQTLSQLLHLCQFSNSFIAVVGENGVGKSTLKQAVVNHLDQEDLVCEVRVPVLTACETLLKDIAQQLDVSLDVEDEAALSKHDFYLGVINRWVKSHETFDQLKVLLIEDAHNLDDLSLQSLVSLAKPDAQSHRQLHVVLFGEPQLSGRVQQYSSNAFMVKQFELEAFSREELKAYLRFRLQAAGFEGIFPFRDEDMQFLWDISHGLPASAHDAAREILIELAMPPPEPRAIGLPVGHMALVIGLVAILLVAVFYSGEGLDGETKLAVGEVVAEVSDSSSPIDDNGAGEDDSAAPDGDAVSVDVPAEELKNNSLEGGERMPVVSTTPAASTELIEGAPPSVATVNVLDNAEAASSKAATPTQNGAIQPLISVVDKKVEPQEAPEASIGGSEQLRSQMAEELASLRGESFVDDEKRLLAQGPEGFTLQILASGSEIAVREYVQRQPNRNELAVFASQREGKTLFIVVAGVYDSSAEARGAVALLPTEQKKAGPWPRSLQSVHSDILAKK